MTCYSQLIQTLYSNNTLQKGPYFSGLQLTQKLLYFKFESTTFTAFTSCTYRINISKMKQFMRCKERAE
jgi:hypothetical protein